MQKQFVQVVVTNGVFAPCEYLGHQFVDGGILDNIPAGEVRKLGADKVLTVKFATDLNYKPISLLEVVLKSIDIMFDIQVKEAIKESDLVLNINAKEASVFNSKKIDYCYEMGYAETLLKIEEIKKLVEE